MYLYLECYTLPYFHHLMEVTKILRYFKGFKARDSPNVFKNHLINIWIIIWCEMESSHKTRPWESSPMFSLPKHFSQPLMLEKLRSWEM